MSRKPSHVPIRADLARALEEVAVPAYVLSREGRIRWLNRRALDLIGDVVGQPFSRVVVRENVNLARTEFARMLLGETNSECELTIQTIEDVRLVVRISSTPLWEAGRISGVFGLAYSSAGRDSRSAGLGLSGAQHLTARQFEVLVLLADGLGTTEIAERLGVADETARNHIRALLSQLGVHSRLAAVVRAYRLGLLTPRREN
jgi:DNA-binding CsgD family transcriptional regulator